MKAAPLRRADRRRFAIFLTVILIGVGGTALYWFGRPAPEERRRAHAEQALKNEIAVRFQQGVIMLHAKQYEHALTAFHRVLQLAPTLPEAHVNAGFALVGLGRHKEALVFFETATTLRPDQINAYYGMAMAFEGLGDYTQALGAMESYLHRAKSEDPYRRKAEAAVWEWRERLPQRK